MKPIAIEILFEDDNLVAVKKPAGLATIPGRGESDSVVQRLAAQLDLALTGTSDPRIRLVHRLDKDTSGVLLLAKNLAAQRHLSHQFQNNTVQKEYLAIVVGTPDAEHGEIDAPIGRHPTARDRMAVLRHEGRPARTQWKLEESFRHLALLRVFPKTGKTHQIRVHLMHAGLPLAVDPLYNRPRESSPGLYLSSFKRGYRHKPDQSERPLIERLTLHAVRLGFRDLTGDEMTLDAPLPRDFRAALNQLRRHGSR